MPTFHLSMGTREFGKDCVLKEKFRASTSTCVTLISMTAKIIVLFMAALSLAPSLLFAESIRVGYFNVPPYVWKAKESNELTGASVEFLGKKIAPEMGVHVIWPETAVSVARQLFQLEHNELDAALVCATNPERVQLWDFPRHAFLETSPVLAVLKHHPLRQVRHVDDLLGLKIGYVYKAFLSPFMKDKSVKLEMLSHNDPIISNLTKLLAGRIDAQYQPDEPPLLFCAKRLDAQDRIRIIRLPEKILLYTVFARKTGRNLAERYDRAFEKVGGKQTYLKILSRYIDVSDIYSH